MTSAQRLPWLLLLTLAACHDAQVDKAEADLVRAKADVAALKTKQQQLIARAKQSELSRWALTQQADDASLATAQLQAAEQVLQGKPLAPAFELAAMLTS